MIDGSSDRTAPAAAPLMLAWASFVAQDVGSRLLYPLA